MITKHGREFASNAELRRYEANNPQMPHVLNGCMCQMGECEACNAVAEAFEAMREALHEVSEWYESEYPYDSTGDTADRVSFKRISRWRAALALADKVTR